VPYSHIYTASLAGFQGDPDFYLFRVYADPVRQRLSYPYIYGYPIFWSSGDVRMHANAVTQNPALGHYLRSFQFRAKPIYSLSGLSGVTNQLRCTLSSELAYDILSQSPQLTRISALKVPDEDFEYSWILKNSLNMSWHTFETIALTAGPVLEYLEDITIEPDTQELQCPSIFGSFPFLRSLGCRISTRFKVVEDSISPHHLSTLECLRIWYCHSSFLEFLSCLECVFQFI
jgi:hypothetical protein